MTKIFRRCPTCHQLFEGRQCKACANRTSKKRQEQNEARKLYGSKRWAKIRDAVRAKFFDYDIWLLAVGQLVKCKRPIVHHIKERDEAPELIYDMDNLVVVSYESHEEIHAAYLEDKAAAVARIARGKEEFRRLFER